MARVNTNRVYEDYDPPTDLVTEEGCDTILIYLPGYRKEQLRVQLTTSRILKISGERQVGENKWKRFHKEFHVPTNCDTKEITAKFEGGILYIRQPKSITPASAAPVQQPAAPVQQPAEPVQQPADTGKPAAEAQKAPPQQQPAPASPQPQPRPQQQSEAPLSEPEKGFEEEKMRANGKSEITKKDEGGKGQCGLDRPSQVGGRGFFSELKKPENLKRLVVSVLVVVSIGFYASYMFKSFMGDETESVQLTPSRMLKVFGERPTVDNKWRRFHKEFQVPSNIEMKGMTAKFDGGILYIRQPKVIAPEPKEEDQQKTAAEAPASPEGKMEKKDEREEDATEKRERDGKSEEKTDERREKSELNQSLAAQAGRSSDLFKELRKPEKLKKLVVYVVLLLILAFQITKTFKSSNKVEQHGILEYDYQNL
ncbi:Inactive protein RESTRICTED TEV MOVEMENT 2 [Bienertia sinuspersici]